MRRTGLLVQVFAATVVVTVLSVVTAGLITRNELSAAFDSYLANLPTPGLGMGPGARMGHRLLGAAEQTFIATVDRGILVGAAIAIGLAALAALGLAYYLTRPLERLTEGARSLADGDLDHRVDVSGPAEVGRLGEAFNEMAESLSRAEELRRRLVADVAHELRNPVAGLRAQAEGMAEGVLPVDAARLESVVDDTRQLSRLVDDLQELSVAEAGRLSYEFTEVDVCALVRREVERAASLAAGGVTVAADCSGPTVVDADEGRLSQVLRNLLGNALRHTDVGSVTVAVTAEDGNVRVEVRDTGEGIPEEDLQYVFERFYRADTARARETGGTGIGLAIAKRIIEDHAGTVFARNREDGGAVVGFTLPLERSRGV